MEYYLMTTLFSKHAPQKFKLLVAEVFHEFGDGLISQRRKQFSRGSKWASGGRYG